MSRLHMLETGFDRPFPYPSAHGTSSTDLLRTEGFFVARNFGLSWKGVPIRVHTVRSPMYLKGDRTSTHANSEHSRSPAALGEP